ncbi:MAG: rhodanese-like domain-containing protein [Gammaproteobacteria bacterium]|nr:rhodanese-like domain-containing protein [Gammaproteobacteria bacterium]MDH3933828.1 rhodanese-like domain-containing protein [Gammaproteobacteria bacterium]MDH3984839.1 rhodanese-like domain-containing protein [Gammaproteobacteria bacterium]
MQTVCRATAGSLAPGHVEALLASGGQLVDVRSPADFRRDSLPGALNLPLDSLCYEHHQLNSRRPVIVYGASEVRSVRAARLLAGKGFSRIYHLAAGR